MTIKMTVAVTTTIEGAFIHYERRFISIVKKLTSEPKSVDAGLLIKF